FDGIKQYIDDNDMHPGDRLPTEQELESIFNVSRRVIREALKSLEALGIVKIKAGDGVYVSEFDYSKLARHFLFSLSREGVNFSDVQEARILFEQMVLEQVIDRLEESTYSELERIIDAMDKAETMEEKLAVDLAFHHTIMGTVKNPILIEFSAVIREFFIRAQQEVDGSEIKTEVEKQKHRRLLETLHKRDLAAAKAVISEHITGNQEYFELC
ncbi:MAG: GntR family transcriptional regulator, partial [Candidatus Izemoplasmatales bacterium]|nr:GntR family transcriptional regulator [Candidatus Izemoplasmatales bacterium]